MDFIVEATIPCGPIGEGGVEAILEQMDLTGSPAELFFAEWQGEKDTLVCVFQTEARNKGQAVNRTAQEVRNALWGAELGEQLKGKVLYSVRRPEYEYGEDEDEEVGLVTKAVTLTRNLAFLALPLIVVGGAPPGV